MGLWPSGTTEHRGPVPLRAKRHNSKFFNALAKWASFDILSLFEPKPPPALPRHVLVNAPVPYEAWRISKRGKKQLDQGASADTVERLVGKKPDEAWLFPSNQVITAKYNLVTFLPKNLVEQFRRVANIFFLVLVILQFFPRFSNVSPALACLPLLIVLAITGLKDGYEDVKRHQSDTKINNIKVHVLAGGGFVNPYVFLIMLPLQQLIGLTLKYITSNMAAPKTRALTLKGIGRFFSSLKFWKSKSSDSNEMELQSVKQIPKKKFTGDMRNRRTWWGKRIQPLDTDPITQPLPTPRTNPDIPEDNESDTDSESSERADLSELDDEPDIDVPNHIEAQKEGNHHTISMDSNKSKWHNSVWENLKVGDFVRLRGDDSIPADILICSSSEEDNVCFVETKNLDGETNLKTRSALPDLTKYRTAPKCARAKFTVFSEAPDVSMNRYSASVELNDGTMGKNGHPLRAPVTLSNMLLRGCVLRNTDWVIGIVVFTGRDTKIVLNSGATPSKRSKVERQMNPQVFVNLALLGIMCALCAIGDHFSEVYYHKRNAPWQFGDHLRDDNPNINGIITFANGMITFQNIVPISLYISIEFIRLAQAFFIWADDEIKYKPSSGPGRRAFARSWNLTDDLGQIEYIFSDKTGTLTQNSMQFRRCSISGKVYRGEDHESMNPINSMDQDSSETKHYPPSAVQPDEKRSMTDQYTSDGTRVPSPPSMTNMGEGNSETKGKSKAADVMEKFCDKELMEDMKHGDPERSERLRMFFTNLALCHTVLTSETEGGIEYKAQSPDEAALVQAAADVGFIFRAREKDIVKLQVCGQTEPVAYELLNVIEFTSARKRMSVVVRKVAEEDTEIVGRPKPILFSKGADNIIFERLREGNEELKEQTDKHLELFATEGLRTLTLAYRELEEEEYEAWDAEYHEAEVSIDGREESMERIADQLEQNLILLGATAIEDKLQDGVPAAIGDLKRAGIKVWVATGDKLETAIAIGMSSNLLTRDMNLIIIRGGKYGDKSSVYEQLRKALVQFFPEGQEIVPQLEHQPPDAEPQSRRRSLIHRRTSQPRSSRQLQRTQTGLSGITDLVDADNGQKPGGYGLVIEGTSLTHAFDEPYSKDILLELATRCDAVVCCRTSPLQKALIVRLVRDGLGAMCLAIGDGANDVSMIQAADVGVGVAGEEGMQAVNASDYAIGQFRFLARLLLLHGHWDYVRNSNLIMNFWEKELIGVGILFWFQFYCLYSTTTVYEYPYLLFWNVFWTIAPVLAVGLFERHAPERVLMQVPELYSYGRKGTYFGLWRFSWYMMDGIYQSIVCFFFIVYFYDTTTAREDGFNVGLYEMSTVMAISGVWVSSAYIALNAYALTWWLFWACVFGPVVIILFTVVYSAISPGWIWTTVFGNNHYLFRAAAFWFGWILTFMISLFPRYLVRYYKTSYEPNDIDIIRWVAKFKPFHNFADDKAISGGHHTTSMSSHAPMMTDSFNRSSFGTVEGGVPPPPAPQTSSHTRHAHTGSTTDMSTGLMQTPSRGYAFDQADGIGEVAVGRPLRRYTSSLKDGHAGGGRPRSRSIKFGNFELGLPTLKMSSKRRGTLATLTSKRSRNSSIGSSDQEGSQQPASGAEGAENDTLGTPGGEGANMIGRSPASTRGRNSRSHSPLPSS